MECVEEAVGGDAAAGVNWHAGVKLAQVRTPPHAAYVTSAPQRAAAAVPLRCSACE